MILDSDRIQDKAKKTRARLTETEARVAEGMVTGKPFDEIRAQLGIEPAEFENICSRGLTNIYFWQLLAACNTREAELYRDAVDDLKATTTQQQKMISALRESDVLH